MVAVGKEERGRRESESKVEVFPEATCLLMSSFAQQGRYSLHLGNWVTKVGRRYAGSRHCRCVVYLCRMEERRAGMPGWESQWAGRWGPGWVVKKESVHMQGVAAVLHGHGQLRDAGPAGPVCSPSRPYVFPFEGDCRKKASGSGGKRRASQYLGGLCHPQQPGLHLKSKVPSPGLI